MPKNKFKPSKRLMRKYEEFNKLYFDNQLPHDINVGWNELEKNMYATLAVNIWTTEADGLEHRVLEIHLDPRRHYGPEQYLATLLHEMIHLKLLPYRFHGKRFKNERRLLMLKGAFDDLL